MADAQRAGRGRLGRSWWSEPGRSLLTSWLVRPALEVERWPTVTLVAGLAAARALIAAAGLEVRLKWPNDLLVDGRKLGGLLAEADGRGALVVGLGVNVRQTEFPAELAELATSVAAAGGKSVERAWLLAATLSGFGARMEHPSKRSTSTGRCATPWGSTCGSNAPARNHLRESRAICRRAELW